MRSIETGSDAGNRGRASLGQSLLVALLALGSAAAVALAAAGPASAQTYAYHGSWQGQSVALTHVRNANVEALSDAQEIGQLTDFQTDDPAYSCLNGRAVNVWRAPAEYPNELVAHNGNQGSQCAYGTWTFRISSSQGYSYSGFWAPLFKSVSLTKVANANVESLPDASLQPTPLLDFQTNDPQFSCLDGGYVSVWYAPKEYPGVLVAHNGDQRAQCAYGTWTLSAPLPPPPPPPQKGFTGISSGISVATITVTSVEKINSSDFAGPY